MIGLGRLLLSANRRSVVFVLFALFAGISAGSASAQNGGVKIDPALPKYKPAAGVAGTLRSVGSDTMNNLVTLWTEEFKKTYPGVKTEVDGKGSSNAIPALIAGTASLGPMSRDAKGSEINDFQKKYGYKPILL